MKILRFTAENIKGIKVVQIEPKGDVVTISGKNGAGKSTVLNCIEKTLCGGSLALSNGANRGEVGIDLGDFTVERHITQKTDRLIVKNKEGATFDSPRAFLSKFIGSLSIDPLSFVRLDEKEQIQVLFNLCPGLQDSLSKVDSQIESIREERSQILRDQKRAQVEASKPLIEAPDKEVSVKELLTQLEAANVQAKAYRESEQARNEIQNDIYSLVSQENELRERLTVITTRRILHEENLKNFPGVPKPNDTSIITANIAKADTTNIRVRANQVITKAKAEETKLANSYSEKGKEMKRLGESKVALLASVPVQGLSVDSAQRVLFNGVPVSELSTAEKVKVGAAIAVSQNPKAQIILVDDVSLLDSENLSVLHSICKDFQIWQVINDSTGKEGFFIEEGTIKEGAAW